MEEKKISFPCLICKVKSNVEPGLICEPCEIYLDQDRHYQRERLLDLDTVEAIGGANLLGRANRFVWADPSKPPKMKSFNTLIRKVGVTRRQREVLKLHFEEGLSLFSIGEKLGIPKDCVWSRYRRGFEKLKKRATKLQWMKGKGKSNSPNRESNVPKPVPPTLSTLPTKAQV